MPSEFASRRDFLETLAALGLLGITGEAGAEADRPRELKPTGANLGSLFPDVEKLADANRYLLSFLGDRFQKLDEFKKTAREKLFDVLLYHPDKVDPKPEVVETVDEGDYVREKVLFNTSPLFRIPAYVLIPKKVKTPAPAIVDLHSHGGMFLFGKEKVIDLGKANHEAMLGYHERNYDGRPTATALVRRGYVVISIDAFMFGERRILMDVDLKHGYDRARYSLDDVKALNQKCRGKEDTIVKGLCYAGLTWPGIVFWDDIRTVDYLVTRPEVDPKRIGCLGISMGGWRTSFLAGLDERISAACVVGFMSTMKPMIKSHLDTHSFVHFVPGLHRYLDLPDVASMMAPKPLMVQQCSKDGLFPLSGMKESLDKIAAIYKKAGVKDRFDGRFYDEPHKFTKPMQDDAFTWFDKQFKGS
ncbi:MAG: alpha/beta hydrolase family protein [Gemmataceae bacterium]|nr:alpha/beta hydrolase family protein [Gemmataceae bacterium]